MTRAFLLLALVSGVCAPSSAAELPNRKPTPAAPAKTCDVDGVPGFVIAGTGTCMRLFGGLGVETTVVKSR